jgi:hypothetical protein
MSHIDPVSPAETPPFEPSRPDIPPVGPDHPDVPEQDVPGPDIDPGDRPQEVPPSPEPAPSSDEP